MVDVSDGTDVHMGFGTLEFFFSHMLLLFGFVPPNIFLGGLMDYKERERAVQEAREPIRSL
jgi:hypothetical protein